MEIYLGIGVVIYDIIVVGLRSARVELLSLFFTEIHLFFIRKCPFFLDICIFQ